MNINIYRRLCSPCRSLFPRVTMSTLPLLDKADDDFKKRSVVSNFIFNFDTLDGKPQVALFRRSAKVSTYTHHLAPISGSIEKTDPSPLAAAWREINEETTLTPASLVLFRQGKPYTFRDPAIRRQWTIYPFAFRLRSGTQDAKKIKIDWEHESWDWYDPHAVHDSDSFGGVPRLAESLRRVWFEKDIGNAAGRILSDGLNKLANDFTSGARQMAGDALKILRYVIAALDVVNNQDPEIWWTNVRFAAWHIWKNGRESMGAAIMTVLLSALSEIEKTTITNAQEQHSPSQRVESALAILDRRINSRRDSAKRVSDSFQQYLARIFPSKLRSDDDNHRLSILTLSESSTITQALRHIALSSGFTLDLRILESRPLFEGVSLAASLVKDLSHPHPTNAVATTTDTTTPHQITVYTDASAALASHSVDLVIIGADRVASSGAVSNKTGTLPAILAARYVTSTSNSSRRPAKVLVLTESEKVAPAPDTPQDHVIEEGGPNQIFEAWEVGGTSRIKDSAKVLVSEHLKQGPVDKSCEGTGGSSDIPVVKFHVRNISFEWCPPELIDVYITESGEWTVKDIAAHSDKLGEEERKLFGAL